MNVEMWVRALKAARAGADPEAEGDAMTIDKPQWRTSSRSTDSGGNCVEVADNLPSAVLVRDSKDRSGPTLTFAPDTWRAFVARTPRGGCDSPA
jgi:hypothetical protein